MDKLEWEIEERILNLIELSHHITTSDLQGIVSVEAKIIIELVNKFKTKGE